MKDTRTDSRTRTQQVRLRGKLTARTALRIGAGRSYDVLGDDLPVVKDSLDRPVIPGSSLKGALRAYAESVLRALKPLVEQPDADPPLSCDPLTQPCLSSDEVTELKQGKNADTELRARTCWACRLFGAPWLASRVLVKDLAVQEATWFGHFGHRDGVSINRDKGTAQHKKRYTFETVPEQTSFDFEMVVNDGSDVELGLLLLTLDGINNGQISIGGASSRGLGSISLDVDWDHVEQITPDNALEALGARVLGEDVPTTAWSPQQRDKWVLAFFHAIDLAEAMIERWQTARHHGRKEIEHDE